MPGPEDVAREARSWVGTPFRHQGRLKGVGVDCLGLVVMTARELGVGDTDETEYSRFPDGRSLRRALGRHLEQISLGDMQLGDVLLLDEGPYPCHLALVSARTGHGLRIVHAALRFRRVVEHDLDEVTRAKVRGVYRFPGLA